MKVLEREKSNHGSPKRNGGVESADAQQALWYRRAMEQLITVVQELSLARNIETIMSIVRRAAKDLTGADGATFVLREGDQCYYAEENAISPLWKGRRFPMDVCISGWVMLNRQAAVIEDIYADPRIPAEAYRPTFVRSLAMVPIRTMDPIGAIGNYWAKQCRPNAAIVRLLQALADTTAVAMENVRVYGELEERVCQRTVELEVANRKLRREVAERVRTEAEVRRLSLTDELTGLYNRRGFLLLGEQQLRIARRTNAAGWLVFADLDGLKKVNDAFGHEVGDEMITETALLLRENFRDVDVIGRLGGDEFVVFAISPEDRSETIRARLQAAMDRLNKARAYQYQLSMSIGIVHCDPQAAIPLSELLTQADEAMYCEKRAKRGAEHLPAARH